MTLPPITVLIPAYNAEKTIDRALESVWRQDYGNLEVLVVDDGSTDGTAALAARHEARGVRLIRRARNGGECAAMNTGIACARHELIAFLDADDEWLDGKLHKQVPIIAARPQMTFVSCGGHFLSPEGIVISRFGGELPPYTGAEFWRSLLFRSYVAKPTVIARRQGLIEVGGFDPQLKIAGDQDMWIKLALLGEVGFVPADLLRVHDTPGSLMKRFGSREVEYTIPMVRRHLYRVGGRLSAAERRDVLRNRYANSGRNMYANGESVRGAGLVLRAVFLGHRRLENLAFLVTASPLLRPIKQILRPVLRLAAR
jgi:glycosyltransferase involved in cell wall biosynthesis